jgi:hypothetical protein
MLVLSLHTPFHSRVYRLKHKVNTLKKVYINTNEVLIEKTLRNNSTSEYRTWSDLRDLCDQIYKLEKEIELIEINKKSLK